MGNGLPPTYNDTVLEPWIQQCLEPLPTDKVVVKEVEVKPIKMKAFKVVGEKSDLKEEFRDEINELK